MTAYQDGKQWRWRRQIRVRGEKKRGSGTPEINTRTAALNAEHDWVQGELEGRRAPLESPTLAAVADDYLDHVALHRSRSLSDGRKSHLAVHLVPHFGRTRLDRIDLAMVDRFKAAQLDEGYAPGSINQHLFSLSNLLRWAQKRGWLRDVLAIEHVPDDMESEEIQFLSAEQVDQLIDVARGELRTMVIVAIKTGLRIGELLALQWSDVDLKGGRLTVRRSMYRGIDGPTKTRRPRTVPLTTAAVAALKSTATRFRGLYVFCESDGTRADYTTHYRRLAALGVPGWHVLRHTFGTALAARGVPLRAIQEWMGHASIKSTMVYAHYSPVFDSAIELLDGPETWQPRANPVTSKPNSGGKSRA